MSSPDRRCHSCRHFEPSPIPGKGWCRNPILFAPQHRHLVDAHKLDCQRAFGDFWQPRSTSDEPSAAPEPMAPAAAVALPRWRSVGRYRTAVAALALVLIITAVLPLARGEPASPDAPATTAPPIRTPAAEQVASPSPPVSTTPSATVVALVEQPTPTVAGASKPQPLESVPTPTPKPEPVRASAEAPAAPTPTPSTRAAAPASLPRLGEQGIVATGNPSLRLRVRSLPDLNAAIIGRIPDKEQVKIVDGPRQADGYVWWKVEYANLTGWVAGAFLNPSA